MVGGGGGRERFVLDVQDMVHPECPEIRQNKFRFAFFTWGGGGGGGCVRRGKPGCPQYDKRQGLSLFFSFFHPGVVVMVGGGWSGGGGFMVK